MWNSFTITIIMLFLLSGPVYAKTLYVDMAHASCSDNTTYVNNSESAPWCSVGRAAWGSAVRSTPDTDEAAQAGDTTIIKAGTYNAEDSSGIRTRAAYNPANSGTTESPITFRAEGAVYLQSTNETGPVIGSESRNYIIWDGFIIDEEFVYTNTGPFSDTGPVVIWSSTGSQILNCNISGYPHITTSNHNGIRLEDSTDIVIKNNIIHGYDYSGNINESAITTYHTSNVLIENNRIYDCYRGIFIKGNNSGPESGFSYRNENYTIRYNWISDVNTAFMFTGANNSKIYQNVVVSPVETVSFFIHASDDTNDPPHQHDIAFVNNTSVGGDGYQAIQLRVIAFRNVGNIFANNIISLDGTKMFFAAAPYEDAAFGLSWLQDTSEFLSDRNNFHNFYSSYFSELFQTQRNIDYWTGTVGQDTNSIVSDPLFVNVPGNNFKLDTNSPALTLGRTITEIHGSSGNTIPAGAYITGNEVIGIDSGISPPSYLRRSGVTSKMYTPTEE